MSIITKIFLIIFSFFCILQTVYAQSEIIEKTAIWKDMVQWRFVPLSFLTLKKPIRPPEIFANDSSIFRFVSVNEPLSSKNYAPETLVTLSGANISQAGRVSMISAVAKPALEAVAKEFSEYFQEPLVGISAFRDVEYQQKLWDLWRCDSGAFCAKPGESEHQLGLTVDFFDATSETQYVNNPRYRAFVDWMQKNAHRFGWTQSYQHGPLVDNYEVEPWHWRYVGVERATILHNAEMSYTKYVQILRAISQL